MGAFAASVPPAAAQMLGTSARQLPAGSLKILGYYQGVQAQTVRFSPRGSAGCVTANGLPFPCSDADNVDASGDGGMGVVKLVYQPWDNIQYYAALGVGDYRLSVPQSAGTLALTGDNPGLAGTFGLRAVLYPDTDFTPGIAVDGSLSDSRYAFNRQLNRATLQTTSVNEVLDFWQYQVAVEASHLFRITEGESGVDHQVAVSGVKVEPYGGLKWTRTRSDLHDLQAGSHVGGVIDVVSPFLGVRVPVYEHEGFFAEASFVEGYQYAAGMEIRFR